MLYWLELGTALLISVPGALFALALLLHKETPL